MKLDQIREFLRGKKSYITAAIGLLGAVIAWADGQIDNVALLGSIWAAVQVVFVRAGVANEVRKQAEAQ